MKNKELHAGHRERLRERFLKSNGESLQRYELLELLLTYALPRKNTNEIAHELMRRFGSLHGVFAASREELTDIDGVGENCAVLLMLENALRRELALEERETHQYYDTLSKVRDYVIPLFEGLTVERLYLLMFDNKMKMIDCVFISEGTTNAAAINMRKIVERSLLSKASNLILVHNHPDGVAIPSSADRHVTIDCREMCNLMGIHLIEHLIVAGDRCTPTLFDEGYDPYMSADPTEYFHQKLK